MSKNNFAQVARRELDNLNTVIDQKIIRGLSYAEEARRHKFLISQLKQVRSQSIFERMFSF